jgi:uncharacterized protein YecE (DUF72 family)
VGDPGALHLWAGTNFPSARPGPIADLLDRLRPDRPRLPFLLSSRGREATERIGAGRRVAGMRLHVGCAQWTHPAWPNRHLPAHDRLRDYANRCNAVEGNTTFYATPTPETVKAWVRQTDPAFRFVLKVPKLITHENRLRDGDEMLRAFLDAMSPLGERAYAYWIQLPASFSPAETATLERFLARFPQGHRLAVEVRHPGFFEHPERLEEALGDAEWVPFDTTSFFSTPPESDAEREAWRKKPRTPLRTRALTQHPIVRYLGRDDPRRTREGWQRWVAVVAGWLREGREPTFFVHTPDNVEAPALARRFHDEVRARVPELEPLPDPEPVGPLTLF